MKKVLIKDLVIPKGTVFMSAPKHTLQLAAVTVEAIFGLTKDTYGNVFYHFKEGLNKKQQSEIDEYFTDLID